MKKISLLFSAVLVLFLTACTGPEGPPGFDGQDGLDGVNIVGQVIEIQGDFTAANDYSLLYAFPSTVEVLPSDVVLTYILWDEAPASGGGTIDVWRLLPQTLLVDQGILQYNYDFTQGDVSIFLDANFDLATLLPGDTDNQVFRIAVVPADFVSENIIDPNTFGDLLNTIDIDRNIPTPIRF
jgi:hypothetical protein